MANKTAYDVIVVGAGAAGLSAAMYASRRTLTTLVLSKDFGGQAALTNEIENYPGRELTDGFSLMQDFRNQAERFGAEVELQEVTAIQQEGEGFRVNTPMQSLTAKSIILAFGLTPRDLGVPGEDRLKGRGVSYCATCDAPFFKGKKVVVVGGGNSALDAADVLSRLAASVLVVHRQTTLTGNETFVERLSKLSNVHFRPHAWPKELKGDNHLTSMILEDVAGGTTEELAIDGCFVEIGHLAKTDFVASLVKLNERRRIIIDLDGATSTPGVFAAGDITTISYKQVVISAGEGAKAALSAYRYLQSKGFTTGSTIDWGVVSSKPSGSR